MAIAFFSVLVRITQDNREFLRLALPGPSSTMKPNAEKGVGEWDYKCLRSFGSFPSRMVSFPKPSHLSGSIPPALIYSDRRNWLINLVFLAGFGFTSVNSAMHKLWKRKSTVTYCDKHSTCLETKSSCKAPNFEASIHMPLAHPGHTAVPKTNGCNDTLRSHVLAK